MASLRLLLLLLLPLMLLEYSSSSLAMAAKTRHFKWAVEYIHWTPDGEESVVMGINGQFPGPTIRARAGDLIVVELTNKLHTKGVVMLTIDILPKLVHRLYQIK